MVFPSNLIFPLYRLQPLVFPPLPILTTSFQSPSTVLSILHFYFSPFYSLLSCSRSAISKSKERSEKIFFEIDSMKVEAAGCVEQLRRSDGVGYHVDKVIKKKRFRKKVRIQLRRMENSLAVSGTLQQLFDSCKRCFQGPGSVPSSTDVQNVCRILDGMKPQDVGLSKNLHFFRPNGEIEGTPRVTTATIYKCDNFELSIFFLPATAVIPLHNHPEMTVFSKLLLGSMHIKSYDWADPPSSISPSKHTDGSSVRLAKLEANRTFTAPCDTSVLYPNSGGNIHEFRAITPCAVLDVIGPPYSKDDGRDCTYYQEVPLDASLVSEMRHCEGDGASYGWLKEIEIPKESEMDWIEYMGPQIDDSICI